MSTLVRQIEVLDKAVEEWKSLEKDLHALPHLLAKETKDTLSAAMDSYKNEKEKEINALMEKYNRETEEKVRKEMEELKNKVWGVYKEKKSAMITDLIHKLHGGF